MTYNRLIMRYYLKAGVKTELKLPFANFSDISINNSIAMNKYKHSNSKYYSTHVKNINRSSNFTIKGVITDDLSVIDKIGDIPDTEYKTLQEYIDALNNLESKVNYTFNSNSGTLIIQSIYISSVGYTREFEITGIKLC